MKRVTGCGTGKVLLLSALVSAATTAAVLMLHSMLTCSCGCDALCEGEDDACKGNACDCSGAVSPENPTE